MSELWKQITEFDDYEISSFGNIRATKRGKTFPMKQRFLFGYCYITLAQQGRKRQFRVHRLVATAFIGPCPDGLQCAHLDGIKTNNRADNLKWTTCLENQSHRLIHGTRFGEHAGGASKMSNEKVRQIRKEYFNHGKGKNNAKELAKRYDVNPNTIHDVGRMKTWKTVPADETLAKEK